MQGGFHFQLIASLVPVPFIFLQTLIKYGEAQFSNASVTYIISVLCRPTVCFESYLLHVASDHVK